MGNDASLRYRIVDGNVNDLFSVDPETGEVSVAAPGGLRLDNIPTDRVRLRVEVSDGEMVKSKQFL